MYTLPSNTLPADPTAINLDSIATSLSPASQNLVAMKATKQNFFGISAEFPEPWNKLLGHKQPQLIRSQFNHVLFALLGIKCHGW